MKNKFLIFFIIFFSFINIAHSGPVGKIIQLFVKNADNIAPKTGKIVKESDTIISEGAQHYLPIANRTLRETFKCNKFELKVTSENAYVHNKANIKSNVLGRLEYNENVCIENQNNEWYKTKFGWVMTKNF